MKVAFYTAVALTLLAAAVWPNTETYKATLGPRLGFFALFLLAVVNLIRVAKP